MEKPNPSELQQWQCSATRSSPEKTSVPKIIPHNPRGFHETFFMDKYDGRRRQRPVD
jgi:hypothetical protein